MHVFSLAAAPKKGDLFVGRIIIHSQSKSPFTLPAALAPKKIMWPLQRRLVPSHIDTQTDCFDSHISGWPRRRAFYLSVCLRSWGAPHKATSHRLNSTCNFFVRTCHTALSLSPSTKLPLVLDKDLSKAAWHAKNDALKAAAAMKHEVQLLKSSVMSHNQLQKISTCQRILFPFSALLGRTFSFFFFIIQRGLTKSVVFNNPNRDI